MRLSKARVQKYRSIRDTGWFDIEEAKTILVGPNEAGKTVLLQALQRINAPEDIAGFDPLRDYPRSEYNDISTGKVKAADVTVVEVHFVLEEKDREELPEGFEDCIYVRGTKLNNEKWHKLDGGPELPTYLDIKNDLTRLCAHIDKRIPKPDDESDEIEKPGEQLKKITAGWSDTTRIDSKRAANLSDWLEEVLQYVEEENEREETRHQKIGSTINVSSLRETALKTLANRLPVFVLFSNYFRVKPLIHLEHLAERIKTKVLDDEQYDFGNQCLLKLLGFTARELSDLGNAEEPELGDAKALKDYRDSLDKRSYQLNAASVHLTNEIRSVWQPDPNLAEADQLRVLVDSQYLKVVVEDDLGVEIELHQRSEGFQWIVSFFIVFFAETSDKHKNAILLLDEPGLSLHGLKQREFRKTISRLAETNQTVYTTHSPFLVGPDELDLVRVVEMKDRQDGTKVHTKIMANDPAALLPLQEALGYDLAQSLFCQKLNFVLEGLTDYWYVDAVSQLLRESGIVNLNNKIAMVPANSAGKVVYYATILHCQKLKVAALLDSDTAGDEAAKQDVLVHTLGNKYILRTKDFYTGVVAKPEIEDMLRKTLVSVAKSDLGWDVSDLATKRPKQPISNLFTDEVNDFSKYKLSKAFLRWTRDHNAEELTKKEREQWKTLITAINKVLK